MSSSVGMLKRASRLLQQVAPRAAAVVPGQPTPLTHPEVLGEGELQPGVPASEFAARRQALAALLPPGGIALVPSAPIVYMAGVIPYPYRPDTDLLYLTGVQQPACLAAIREDGQFTLFVPDRDAHRETWDGAKINADAAVAVFNADEAYSMSEGASYLNRLISSAAAVVIDGEKPSAGNLPVRDLPSFRDAQAQSRVRSLKPLMHSLRWVKSPAELALMRSSASLAAAGMRECMRQSHPGVREQRMAALFEFKCKEGGAQRMAYPPVVAGGPDACTIHYSRNDKVVPGDQLLLLDGGCELHGYCSDVTRTWPVGGRFSEPQRAVYEAVLEAHQLCIANCRPGSTLRQLHQASVRFLSEGLARLGVLPGRSAGDFMAQQYRRFYPHSVGHWLGMDTHDSSTMQHDKPLEPGVVLTVEPGLYIPNEEEFGPFRGIGVRIEDDIAITADGHEVLSGAVPVEPAAVEALVGSAVACCT